MTHCTCLLFKFWRAIQWRHHLLQQQQNWGALDATFCAKLFFFRIQQILKVFRAYNLYIALIYHSTFKWLSNGDIICTKKYFLGPLTWLFMPNWPIFQYFNRVEQILTVFRAYNWYISLVYYSTFKWFSNSNIIHTENYFWGPWRVFFNANMAYFSVFQQGWTDFNSF